ncbi:MAG: hydrolase, partial [Flavobacteriales bacterium]|nr:hydrolase [Flavobacteriales bacterium]
MKITFFGHASLGIQVGDIHILVDPFISGNPKASKINVDALKADYILLTHAH